MAPGGNRGKKRGVRFPMADAPLTRRRFPAWLRVCLRTWRRADAHRLDLAAAGVAYFALLALFPGLAALVAFYGVLGDPAEIARQVAVFRGLAPPAALDLAKEQLTRLAAAPAGALALSAILSLALAVWSLNRGVAGFRGALIALDERREKGRFVHQTARSFVLTGGAIGVAAATVGLLAVAPAVAAALPGSRLLETWVQSLRWPVLLGAVAGYAAALYRWGVNRHARRWRYTLPPALLAAVAWLAASYALTGYVEGFATLSETYGSLAGAVVLILWLYLTSYVFLLGAEFSFVLENQAEGRAAATQKACAAVLEDTDP